MVRRSQRQLRRGGKEPRCGLRSHVQRNSSLPGLRRFGMSLKKLLVLDGVVAVCRFQDDGSIMDAAGMMTSDRMERMAKFAQWYRRMGSGNMDLFSLFSQMRGW